MWKGITKSCLFSFLGWFIGYLFYVLVSVYIFQVPASKNIAACISITIGIIVFINIFTKEKEKHKKTQSAKQDAEISELEKPKE